MESRQLTTATPPNDSQAPLLLGLNGSFLIIAIILLCARIWSRRWILKADDWTVLGGTLLATVNYTVQCVACTYGLGLRTPFVSPSNRRSALRLLFILQVLFYWSITLVKFSVALLLLRLRPTRRWSAFLYATMAVLLLTVTAQTLLQFLQCRPFSVFWESSMGRRPTVVVKCLPLRVINITIITFNAIHVTTDFVLSFMPVIFIRKLSRPTQEKIFLSILMGLGLFASMFAVLRTITLRSFTSGDFFRGQVMPTLWGTLELEVALIAATIPTLRNFVQRMLVRLGAFFYDEESETVVRGRLVQFGFLVEGEVEEKLTGSGVGNEWERGPRVVRKKRDEFGDTVVEEKEKEIVMIAVSEDDEKKEKAKKREGF